MAEIIRPSASTMRALSSADSTSYGRGSYVQFSSSGNLTSHALLSLDLNMDAGADTEFEIDIGTGASAAEVVAGTFAVYMPLNQGLTIPILPALNIPANERVALRVGSGSFTTSIQTLNAKATFAPRPF